MNILITRHDKIGDFITTLPLFYVVKKNNPDNKVFALVSKTNIELAKKIDFIDEVILYDKSNFWQVFKRIRKAKIDISISAFIDSNLGLILFLCRIKVRIAPATKLAQLFFNKTLKQSRSLVKKTEVIYNLDLAKILDKNISLKYKLPLLKLDNEIFFRKKNRLNGKKIVIFHPGYGGSSDGNLTLKEYLDLARVVSDLHNVQVVWTFGPDDSDIASQIQATANKECLIYKPPTLLDFCYLIRDSELLVSTSTGPMHIAGSLNIKTVSFFGDSLFASPKRWATVSNPEKQHNFIINQVDLKEIQKVLLSLVEW